MAQVKIKPTPPPRTPALVRRRVARTAVGAGAVAAGLILACGGKTGGDGNAPQIAPQAQPPQVAPQPPQVNPPQIAPQPPPPQPPPPQPFDGAFDADDASDAEDAG